MLKQQPAEVVFNIGDLVQIYRNNLDYTFRTEQKLLPKWSTPHRIITHLRNSYRLETLAGTPLEGEFSARHLCAFEPREGTGLHSDQQRYVQQLQQSGRGAGNNTGARAEREEIAEEEENSGDDEQDGVGEDGKDPPEEGSTSAERA